MILKKKSVHLLVYIIFQTHIFPLRTFTFGVGEPIQNSLSPIIILVITAMLGILLVAFIMAGIVYIVKTWKKRRAQNYANLSS